MIEIVISRDESSVVEKKNVWLSIHYTRGIGFGEYNIVFATKLGYCGCCMYEVGVLVLERNYRSIRQQHQSRLDLCCFYGGQDSATNPNDRDKSLQKW